MLTIWWVPLAFLGPLVMGENAATTGKPPNDKTLVSWVALANTTQRGGSALTIQCGVQFDGIVFGERAAGKWMAGSEAFARFQGDQQANPVEHSNVMELIQMAIVYAGNHISIYRNGKETDLMGRFPVNNLGGGAKIEGGRLVLNADGATLIAAGKPIASQPSPQPMPPVSDEAVRAARSLRERFLADPYRPGYHFCVPEDMGEPGDPNGAFYHNGRYHLMYLYNRNTARNLLLT